MMDFDYKYDKVIDKAAKNLAAKRRRRDCSATIGNRINPDTKDKLLALREQLSK